MANLKLALAKLFPLEHGKDKYALHQNEGEKGLTFCGIYELANPKWLGWDTVKEVLTKYQGDKQRASVELMGMTKMADLVAMMYDYNYWQSMKGDKLTSQHIANEIFIFGCNAGMPTAKRKAQEIVKVTADGIFGDKTIEALNAFDEKKFDYLYDAKEVEHYKELAKNKPLFVKYLNGWENRAVAV